jgi:Zn-finger nucleic acid-binding protein
VYFCGNCRGILLPRPVFAGVLQNRRAWATQPPAPPAPLEPAELERKAICPSCSNRMATHPYHGPGNIVIDACETCHVIWLGPDELARAVNAPGRDRGSALRRDESATEFAIRPLSGAGDPDDVPRLALGRRIDLLSLLDDLF